MLRLHPASPRTNKKPPLPGGRRGGASGLSRCSADTLTYEEKRSCDMHAVTIAAWGGQSIQPGAMSCDPEGRSGALVKRMSGAT
jgi:hypothetical protein